MSQPSTLLQALLTAFNTARGSGNSLVLNTQTLQATSATHLLDLFANELQIPSYTLDPVQLPPAVTGDTLTISATSNGVTATFGFQDLNGEIAIQAVFQAAQITTLAQAFPALGAGFFSGITLVGANATINVQGLTAVLSFASPLYSVVGLVSPNSGVTTTSVAPRVDGAVSAPSGTKSLFIELQTATSGYRIGPGAQGWSFADFAWLLPMFDVLNAFPDIIPTSNLNLETFDLNLYPYAPTFSSVSFDVADANGQPLWQACGGKVELNDVIVTLNLDYDSGNALILSGTGAVEGRFLLGSVELDAQIPFPPTGVWVITANPNVHLNVLDDLATLLTGGSIQSLLPANLSQLGSFDFTYFKLAVDVGHFKLVELSFGLESDAPWPLIPSAVNLSSLKIRFTIDGTPAVMGSVIGQFGLPGGSAITVQFGRTSPLLPWRLDVISPAIALPSLSDLAQLTNNTDLGSMVKAGGLDQLHFVMTDLNFGLTMPPPSFVITNLGLTLQLANAADPLSPTLDWELIPGVLALTRFAFGFQLEWGAKPAKNVWGSFAINDLQFDVTFASQTTGTGALADALIAEYHPQGTAGTVDIKQLINVISPSVAAGMPDGITIDLADALLAYINSNGTKKYLFAMDIAVTLPLSELPLIGKALPADAVVALKDLKVIVASAALTADEVALINGLLLVPVLPSPQADSQGNVIPAGFSMMATLQIGALQILMVSPPVPKPAAPGKRLARRPVTVTSDSEPAYTNGNAVVLAAPAAPAAADSTMWIDVQKTFGPVSIQKVGFKYQDGALFAVSNISLNTGGLEIDLLGIGVGTPIKKPTPKFTIDGLAVSFNEGPVSIMGGMIGSFEPDPNFVGALSVRVPEFSLAAFAGYAVYEEHPSFFLYGVLDVPLGGPPPFFITGVAAGFGFNRSLTIPPVSGVVNFPLVAWAVGGAGTPSFDPSQPIGDQVTKALTLLMNAGVVAPTVGEYWFAAGVRFTSFEIIDSFALLTLSFGPMVEIAVLGLSTLTIPPDDSEPVAEVQIALEVSFSPTTGLLAVAGQLTPNSYVLSRSCKLTGGFAFYLWFSGDLAGQTVLSLGGYNPNFTVPPYFPPVPRLGLNWQVIPELNITGGLYFAITPNVVMTGGMLSAVWQSGPIRAWFMCWADFLMQFSPFHYHVDCGIDLGASFTVDLWLFSFSITIHLGVSLTLMGPPFAGSATVDLAIISFTITFGDQSGTPPQTSIPWPDFVQQLLPSAPAQQQSALRRGTLLLTDAAAPPASPPPACTQINVTTGLVKTLPADANGPVFLVNGTTFQCTVLTVIPNKTVTFSVNPSIPNDQNIQYAPDAQQPSNGGVPIPPNTDFSAGPANISAADFQPGIALSLATSTDSALLAIRRLTNAPKAFWETKTFDSHGVAQVDPGTVLTEGTIPNALVGFTLVPKITTVDYTRAVPLDTLLFSLDAIEPFAWSPGVPPTTDSFKNQTVAGTITNSTVATVRSALLGALAAQGVTVSQTVNVQSLQNAANNDIDAAPRLNLLGEQAA